jgi:hypothetical protein
MIKLNDRHRFALIVVVAVCFFSVASASFRASAQQSKTKCPKTMVTCPDTVNAGDALTFVADLRGGDQNVTPTYNWTVSAGTISSGQGTSVITVDTTGLSGASVTATVDVGGYDRECGYGSTASSCTTSVTKKAEARKLDEYGALKPQDENARLDNFVIELQSDPTAQAYLVYYSGSSSRPGGVKKTAARAIDYLVTKRGLDGQRVMTLDGGMREQATLELWIVPAGAPPPQPTPTVKPAATKPASQVKPAAPKKPPARKKS